MAETIPEAGLQGTFEWWDLGRIDGITFNPANTAWEYNAAAPVRLDILIEDAGSAGDTFELVIDGVVVQIGRAHV